MTQKKHAPPKLAEWLLKLISRGYEHFSMLGDIDEEFEEIAAARGPRSARR